MYGRVDIVAPGAAAGALAVCFATVRSLRSAIRPGISQVHRRAF